MAVLRVPQVVPATARRRAVACALVRSMLQAARFEKGEDDLSLCAIFSSDRTAFCTEPHGHAGEHSWKVQPILAPALHVVAGCSHCEGVLELRGIELKLDQGAIYRLLEKAWARHRSMAPCNGVPRVKWDNA